MQDVDLLQDFLSFVESLTPALRESAQTIPLIADTLTPGVYRRAVVILESAATE